MDFQDLVQEHFCFFLLKVALGKTRDKGLILLPSGKLIKVDFSRIVMRKYTKVFLYPTVNKFSEDDMSWK